jgi:hypothetical protein
VGYNVQSATDAKNKLIAHFEVTNEKDIHALSRVANAAKQELEAEKIDALADGGYHAGEELKACAENGITTYVSPKKYKAANKEQDFLKDQFKYRPSQDVYQCPGGQILSTNGKWYDKKSKEGKSHKIKRYTISGKICKACPFKEKCLNPTSLRQNRGRSIERSEYEDYIQANDERLKANKDYYLLRQTIVEHPFGTIKRQWGFDYTLLKTKPKVEGEFGLIFLSYNLRRVISIFGVEELVKKLKEAKASFLGFIRAILSLMEPTFFSPCLRNQSLNRLSVRL